MGSSSDAIGDDSDDELGDEADEVVGENTVGELGEAIGEEVGEDIGEVIGDKIGEEVGEEVSEEIGDEADEVIGDELDEVVGEVIGDVIREVIRGEIGDDRGRSPGWGQMQLILLYSGGFACCRPERRGCRHQGTKAEVRMQNAECRMRKRKPPGKPSLRPSCEDAPAAVPKRREERSGWSGGEES